MVATFWTEKPKLFLWAFCPKPSPADFRFDPCCCAATYVLVGSGDSSLPDLLKYDKSSHRRTEGATDDTQIQKQSTHYNNTDGTLRNLRSWLHSSTLIQFLKDAGSMTYMANHLATHVYQIQSPKDAGPIEWHVRVAESHDRGYIRLPDPVAQGCGTAEVMFPVGQGKWQKSNDVTQVGRLMTYMEAEPQELVYQIQSTEGYGNVQFEDKSHVQIFSRLWLQSSTGSLSPPRMIDFRMPVGQAMNDFCSMSESSYDRPTLNQESNLSNWAIRRAILRICSSLFETVDVYSRSVEQSRIQEFTLILFFLFLAARVTTCHFTGIDRATCESCRFFHQYNSSFF